MATLVIATIDNEDATSDHHVIVGHFKTQRDAINALMDANACHTDNTLWTIEEEEARDAGIISSFKNTRNKETHLTIHLANLSYISINENKWLAPKFHI